MAMLSAAAYSNNSASSNLDGQTLENFLAPEWNLLDENSLPRPASASPLLTWGAYFGEIGVPGYYDHGGSQAFVAERNGTLAIAFRGTDNPLDFGGSINQSAFYENYEQLIDSVVEYAGNPANNIDQIYVTGHSLGGEMAGIFAIEDGHRFAEPIAITTFGSPGVDPNEYPVPTALSAQILNFVHTGDPVPHHAFPIPDHWRLDGYVINIDLPSNPGDATETSSSDHEHNMQIYEANIDAVTSSSLIDHATISMNLIVGGSNVDDSNTLHIDFNDSGSFELDESSNSEPVFILGLDGDDTLRGGSADDLLDGGSGSDLLYGGGGDDLFAFDALGHDTINDFTVGDDLIALISFDTSFGALDTDGDGTLENGEGDGTIAVDVVGADTTLSAGSGSMTILGVSGLTEDDILFV